MILGKGDEAEVEVEAKEKIVREKEVKKEGEAGVRIEKEEGEVTVERDVQEVRKEKEKVEAEVRVEIDIHEGDVHHRVGIDLEMEGVMDDRDQEVHTDKLRNYHLKKGIKEQYFVCSFLQE